MVIANAKIVTLNEVIPNGYIEVEGQNIKHIAAGIYAGNDKEIVDAKGKIAMPGFIDIHTHGSCGIDFMDATVDDLKKIANAFYSEGTTTFMLTTLTSSYESLERVCKVVAEAKKEVPSLGGIHFEGPFLCVKYKGAQNPEYIVKPDIVELKKWIELSNKNVRYITIAPENEGSMEFIEYATKHGVTVSAGHSDAPFSIAEEAIKHGLTNLTHTHNAMSGHHHRNPGLVTAGMYFDSLYTEMICDGIHVVPDVVKTWYKIVGPDRFIIITDALQGKHSEKDTFKMVGLDCVKRNGAAYLTSGPLAGSLLEMDRGLRNVRDYTGAGLSELARMASTNAARSLRLTDVGVLEKGKKADIVLLDEGLHVKNVYKNGVLVFENK